MKNVWYSVCSAHRDYNPDCKACCTGNWVDEEDPEVIADQALWDRDPDAWREKHKDHKLSFEKRSI